MARGDRELSLVSNLSQKSAPLFRMLILLDAFGSEAIDYANNPAALLRFGYDYLNRIRGGAEDIANFGRGLDGSQHVDGKRITHYHGKKVAGCDRLGYFHGGGSHPFVSSIVANQ